RRRDWAARILLQRGNHLGRALVAPGRVLRHHALDELDESLGSVGPQEAERFRLAYLVPDHLLRGRAVLERALADEQVVAAAAEAVDVRPHIDLAVVDLLRRNVVRGADDVTRLEFLDERAGVLVEET